jgi:hypothetical protein
MLFSLDWRSFAALIDLDKASDSRFFGTTPPTAVLANGPSAVSDIDMLAGLCGIYEMIQKRDFSLLTDFRRQTNLQHRFSAQSP